LNNIKIAHRGLHDGNKNIPENTCLSVQHAIGKGYPVEVDVHLTKDNKIIVMHDDNLVRMVGVDKKIRELTYDELSEYTIKNSTEKIPLLTEVLDIVNGKGFILIEIKTYNDVGPLEKEIVKILDNYNGKFAVQSFNPFAVKWFKDNRPEYMRGLLSCGFDHDKFNFIKRVVLRNLWLLRVVNPHFVSYEISDLTKKKAEKIKRNNMKLLTWTVDDEKKHQKALELCDGEIFEKLTL
jgi:glycerophosphoryl diester phosphodiesterase